MRIFFIGFFFAAQKRAVLRKGNSSAEVYSRLNSSLIVDCRGSPRSSEIFKNEGNGLVFSPKELKLDLSKVKENSDVPFTERVGPPKNEHLFGVNSGRKTDVPLTERTGISVKEKLRATSSGDQVAKKEARKNFFSERKQEEKSELKNDSPKFPRALGSPRPGSVVYEGKKVDQGVILSPRKIGSAITAQEKEKAESPRSLSFSGPLNIPLSPQYREVGYRFSLGNEQIEFKKVKEVTALMEKKIEEASPKKSQTKLAASLSGQKLTAKLEEPIKIEEKNDGLSDSADDFSPDFSDDVENFIEPDVVLVKEIINKVIKWKILKK